MPNNNEDDFQTWLGSDPRFHPARFQNPAVRTAFAKEIEADMSLMAESQRQQARQDAAQKQAEREAKAAEKELQAEHNAAVESFYRQQGRPIYKDEFGNWTPSDSDEEWAVKQKDEADKRLEGKRKDREAQRKAELAPIQQELERTKWEAEDPDLGPKLTEKEREKHDKELENETARVREANRDFLIADIQKRYGADQNKVADALSRLEGGEIDPESLGALTKKDAAATKRLAELQAVSADEKSRADRQAALKRRAHELEGQLEGYEPEKSEPMDAAAIGALQRDLDAKKAGLATREAKLKASQDKILAQYDARKQAILAAWDEANAQGMTREDRAQRQVERDRSLLSLETAKMQQARALQDEADNLVLDTEDYNKRLEKIKMRQAGAAAASGTAPIVEPPKPESAKSTTDLAAVPEHRREVVRAEVNQLAGERAKWEAEAGEITNRTMEAVRSGTMSENDARTYQKQQISELAKRHREQESKTDELLNERMRQYAAGEITGAELDAIYRAAGDPVGGTERFKRMIQGQIPGMEEPGNLAMKDVKSASGIVVPSSDGKEALIPDTDAAGNKLADADAIAQFERTGKHFGKFTDLATANAFGERLKKAKAGDYALGSLQEKDANAPAFGFGDTLSAYGEAAKSFMVGLPAALYRAGWGLRDPREAPEFMKGAWAAEDKMQAEQQQAHLERLQKGQQTKLGQTIREAGASFAFSGVSVGASILGGKVGQLAGSALGGLGSTAVGPEGIPVGAVVGSKVGEVAGEMLAGGIAAYRMQGAQFLYEAFELIADAAKKEGKTITDEQWDKIYTDLLPYAQSDAWAEAWPEAAGNALTLAVGKYVFGDTGKAVLKSTLAKFGVKGGGEAVVKEAAKKGWKYLAAQVAKKAGAIVGDVIAETGTETVTQLTQGWNQARLSEYLKSGKMDAPNPYAGADGVWKAWGEVAPQTAVLLFTMGGVAAGVKGVSKVLPDNSPAMSVLMGAGIDRRTAGTILRTTGDEERARKFQAALEVANYDSPEAKKARDRIYRMGGKKGEAVQAQFTAAENAWKSVNMDARIAKGRQDFAEIRNDPERLLTATLNAQAKRGEEFEPATRPEVEQAVAFLGDSSPGVRRLDAAIADQEEWVLQTDSESSEHHWVRKQRGDLAQSMPEVYARDVANAVEILRQVPGAQRKAGNIVSDLSAQLTANPEQAEAIQAQIDAVQQAPLRAVAVAKLLTGRPVATLTEEEQNALKPTEGGEGKTAPTPIFEDVEGVAVVSDAARQDAEQWLPAIKGLQARNADLAKQNATVWGEWEKQRPERLAKLRTEAQQAEQVKAEARQAQAEAQAQGKPTDHQPLDVAAVERQWAHYYAGGVEVNETLQSVARYNPNNDSLEINPALGREYSAEALERVFQEEIIHKVTFDLIREAQTEAGKTEITFTELADFWDELEQTPAGRRLQNLARQAYHAVEIGAGKRAPEAGEATEADKILMACELLRMVVQNRDFAGRVTEAAVQFDVGKPASQTLWARILRLLSKLSQLLGLYTETLQGEARVTMEDYVREIKVRLQELGILARPETAKEAEAAPAPAEKPTPKPAAKEETPPPAEPQGAELLTKAEELREEAAKGQAVEESATDLLNRLPVEMLRELHLSLLGTKGSKLNKAGLIQAVLADLRETEALGKVAKDRESLERALAQRALRALSAAKITIGAAQVKRKTAKKKAAKIKVPADQAKAKAVLAGLTGDKRIAYLAELNKAWTAKEVVDLAKSFGHTGIKTKKAAVLALSGETEAVPTEQLLPDPDLLSKLHGLEPPINPQRNPSTIGDGSGIGATWSMDALEKKFGPYRVAGRNRVASLDPRTVVSASAQMTSGAGRGGYVGVVGYDPHAAFWVEFPSPLTGEYTKRHIRGGLRMDGRQGAQGRGEAFVAWQAAHAGGAQPRPQRQASVEVARGKVAELTNKLAEVEEAATELDAEQQEQLKKLQNQVIHEQWALGLNLASILDPTGITDAVSAIHEFVNGHWAAGTLNVISALGSTLGDVTVGPIKVALSARRLTNLAKAIDKLHDAAKALKPAITKGKKSRIAKVLVDHVIGSTEPVTPAPGEYTTLTEYLDAFEPMKRARVKAALMANVQSGNGVFPRRQLIEEAVADGATIVLSPKGDRRLQKPNGAFRDERQLTKTGMEYAAFLIERKRETSSNPFRIPEGVRKLPEGHPLLTPTANEDGKLNKLDAEIPSNSLLVKEGFLKPGKVSRQELHDAIVAFFLKGAPPQETPQLLLMAGGGAVGKTSYRENNPTALPPKAVTVSADDIKELIPEYDALIAAGDSRAAEMVHQESRVIVKRLLDNARISRVNIVYDTTLSNPASATRLIERFKGQEYKVNVIGMTIDPVLALQRAQHRGLTTGRWVSPASLLGAHQAFNASLETYVELADGYTVVESLEDFSHRLILRSEGGKIVERDEAGLQRARQRANLNREATRESDLYPRGYGQIRPTPGELAGGSPETQASSPGDLRGRIEEGLTSQEVVPKSPHDDGGRSGGETGVSPLVAPSEAEGAPSETPAPGERPGGHGETGGATDQGSERPGQEAGNRAESDRGGAGEPKRGVERGSEQPVRGDDGRGARTRRRPSKRPASESDRNYRITPEQTVAPKGDAAKIEANLTAIALLRKLEEEKRNPTPEEKAVLVQYTGWGAFKEGFNTLKANIIEEARAKWQENNYGYKTFEEYLERATWAHGLHPSMYSWFKRHGKLLERLREALTPAEFKAAAFSTLNAHFTAPEVVREMWRLAQELGFEGGRVLEPGGGIGHFIGLRPEGLEADFATVELDEISSRIFAKLYPEAEVNEQPGNDPKRQVKGMGFQDARLTDNSFDMAIGNVPFAANGPEDGRYPLKLNLHNYFIARSLDKVRPGGIVMLISSESTMQNNPEERDFLAKKGDLIAAIRLPNDAFAENAGTEVTTDILVFRKRDPNAQPSGERWSGLLKVGEEAVTYPCPKGKSFHEHMSDIAASHGLNQDGSKRSLTPEEAAAAEAEATPEPEEGDQKKKPKKAKVYDPNWRVSKYSGEVTVTEPVYVNEYFVEHPEMALGRHTRAGTMYRAGAYALVADEGQETGERLRAAIDAVPKAQFQAGETTEQETRVNEKVAVGALRYQNGEPREWDGAAWIKPEWLTDQPAKGKGKKSAKSDVRAKFAAWDKTRTAAKELLAMESNPHVDPAAREAKRAEARRSMAALVKTYGHPAQRTKNVFAPFESDQDYYLLAALETEEIRFNALGKEVSTFALAPILERAILSPKAEPTTAESVADAVQVSLAWRSAVDVDFIRDLTGKSQEEVEKEFLAGDAVFYDPERGTWAPKSSILSGNLYQKLRMTEASLRENPDKGLERNVAAIKAAMPEVVRVEGISPEIGADWVPVEVYQEFIRDVLLDNNELTVARGKSREYTFSLPGRGPIDPDNYSARGRAKTEEFDTSEENGFWLFTQLLRNANLRAYHTIDRKQIFDQQLTEERAAAAKALRERFEDWVKTTDRKVSGWAIQTVVETAFNENINAFTRDRSFDEDLLVCPDLNQDTETGVWLKPFRRRVVSRFLRDQYGVMAHGVGTGKTFSLIILAHELKRLGKAKRPLIAVKNSTLMQFVAAYYQAYPQAKILVIPDSKALGDPKRRRVILSQMATGDYEAIIMPHSQFDTIPIAPERVNGYIDAQLDELDRILQDLIMSGARVGDLKWIEQQKKKLEEKRRNMLRKIKGREQELPLTWDQLGVDALLIDESHNFKKLALVTRKDRLKGIPNSASQRAMALEMKAQDVWERNGDKINVFGSSGTPITNSMAELYVNMRLFAPKVLEQLGFDTFDSWADAFGREETQMEVTWSNQIDYVTRWSKFLHGDQLAQTVAATMDLELIPKKAGLNLPRIRGGEPEYRIVKPSADMEDFIDWVIAVGEQWDEMKPEDKKLFKAAPIQTMFLGVAAAIDPRLINPELADDPDSKVNQCCREVAEEYKATAGYKGTQVIFCDVHHNVDTTYLTKFMDGDAPLGTTGHKPGSFDLYADIKKKLIAQGIKENEIACVDASWKTEKLTKLFDDLNTGKVRVVIGSTEKIGEGANFQTRLSAAHHLDPPFQKTPAKLEQRNGRILRQGNIHADETNPAKLERLKPEDREAVGRGVKIAYWGVERSMDSAIYQMLATKAGFIQQALITGMIDPEDLNDLQLSMAFMTAQSLGNKDLIRKVELAATLQRLLVRKRAWDSDLIATRNRIKRLDAEIATQRNLVERVKAFPYKEFNERVNNAEFMTLDDRGGGKRTIRRLEGRDEEGKKISVTPTKDLLGWLDAQGAWREGNVTYITREIEVGGVVFEVGLSTYARKHQGWLRVKGMPVEATWSGELGLWRAINLYFDESKNQHGTILGALPARFETPETGIRAMRAGNEGLLVELTAREERLREKGFPKQEELSQVEAEYDEISTRVGEVKIESKRKQRRRALEEARRTGEEPMTPPAPMTEEAAQEAVQTVMDRIEGVSTARRAYLPEPIAKHLFWNIDPEGVIPSDTKGFTYLLKNVFTGAGAHRTKIHTRRATSNSDVAWWRFLTGKWRGIAFQPSRHEPTRGTLHGEAMEFTPEGLLSEFGEEMAGGAAKFSTADLLHFHDYIKGITRRLKKEKKDAVHANSLTMGTFTWSHGKDEDGDYLAYYDRWDFTGSAKGIGPIMDALGQPFEIYGRIYVDWETGKIVNPTRAELLAAWQKRAIPREKKWYEQREITWDSPVAVALTSGLLNAEEALALTSKYGLAAVPAPKKVYIQGELDLPQKPKAPPAYDLGTPEGLHTLADDIVKYAPELLGALLGQSFAVGDMGSMGSMLKGPPAAKKIPLAELPLPAPGAAQARVKPSPAQIETVKGLQEWMRGYAMDVAQELKPEFLQAAVTALETQTTPKYPGFPDNAVSRADLSWEERIVEARFFQQIAADPEKALRDYFRLAKKDYKNPRVVNTDLARDVYPDYKLMPLAMYHATLDAARLVATRALLHLVAQGKKVGKTRMIILAGGPASGKTTASRVLFGQDLPKDVALVVDSPMSTPAKAERAIKTAKENGFLPTMVFVYNPVWRAVGFAVGRVQDEGRLVPLESMIDEHIGALETFLDFSSKQEGVDFIVAENTGEKGKINRQPVEFLTDKGYVRADETREQALQRLVARGVEALSLARAQGQITEAQWTMGARGRVVDPAYRGDQSPDFLRGAEGEVAIAPGAAQARSNTGHAGASYSEKARKDGTKTGYIRATTTVNGVRYQKQFNVDKLGYDEALKAALQWRESMQGKPKPKPKRTKEGFNTDLARAKIALGHPNQAENLLAWLDRPEWSGPRWDAIRLGAEASAENIGKPLKTGEPTVDTEMVYDLVSGTGVIPEDHYKRHKIIYTPEQFARTVATNIVAGLLMTKNPVSRTQFEAALAALPFVEKIEKGQEAKWDGDRHWAVDPVQTWEKVVTQTEGYVMRTAAGPLPILKARVNPVEYRKGPEAKKPYVGQAVENFRAEAEARLGYPLAGKTMPELEREAALGFVREIYPPAPAQPMPELLTHLGRTSAVRYSKFEQGQRWSNVAPRGKWAERAEEKKAQGTLTALGLRGGALVPSQPRRKTLFNGAAPKRPDELRQWANQGWNDEERLQRWREVREALAQMWRDPSMRAESERLIRALGGKQHKTRTRAQWNPATMIARSPVKMRPKQRVAIWLPGWLMPQSPASGTTAYSTLIAPVVSRDLTDLRLSAPKARSDAARLKNERAQLWKDYSNAQERLLVIARAIPADATREEALIATEGIAEDVGDIVRRIQETTDQLESIRAEFAPATARVSISQTQREAEMRDFWQELEDMGLFDDLDMHIPGDLELSRMERVARFDTDLQAIPSKAPPERRGHREILAWWTAERDVLSDREAWVVATDMIARDRDGVIEHLITAALDEQPVNKYYMTAGIMLARDVWTEAVASGDPRAKRRARIFTYAYSKQGTDIARALQARTQANKSDLGPEGINAEYLAREFSRLSRKAQEQINSIPGRRERQAAMEQALDERWVKIEAALASQGITVEEIFQGRAVAAMRSGAVVGDLINALSHVDAERQAIRMFVDGHTSREVAKDTGIAQDAALALRKKFETALRKKFRELNERGVRLTDFAEEGVVILPQPSAPLATVRSDWTEDSWVRSVLPAQEVAETGRLKRFKGADRGVSGKGSLRFDLKNADHAQSLANILATAGAGAWDMWYEYFMNSILSGPVTAFVNVAGTPGHMALEGFVQRPLEAILNLALKAPDAPSFGEARHVFALLGMKELWAKAWAGAVRAFRTEASVFEDEFLDHPVTLATLEKGGSRNALSEQWFLQLASVLSGKDVYAKYAKRKADLQANGKSDSEAARLAMQEFQDENPVKFQQTMDELGISKLVRGSTFRIPGRILLATDVFWKYLIGSMEVGVQAYRIAHGGEKLEGARLAARMKEILADVGGPAYQRAAEVAEALTFTTPIRSQEVKDPDGKVIRRPEWHEIIAAKIAAARHVEGTSLPMQLAIRTLATLVPFVQTPYNIALSAFRRTPLNLVNAPLRLWNGFVAAHRQDGVFWDGYEKAMFARDIADTMIGLTIMGILFAITEGDDDDDDKPFLFVGTHPYGVEKTGERDLVERSRGGQLTLRVGKAGPGAQIHDFSRYDPISTILATVVDICRSVKAAIRGGSWGDYVRESGRLMQHVSAQFSEKTFMQGINDIADLIGALTSPAEGPEIIVKKVQQKAKSVAGAIIPNLVKQPMRMLDNQARERFQAQVGSPEWWYDFIPWPGWAPGAVDLYGRDITRQWSGGPQKLFRTFVDSTFDPGSEKHIYDRFLESYLRTFPELPEGTAPPRDRQTVYRYRDRNGKWQKMTPTQIVGFQRAVGRRFAYEATARLTPQDVKVPTEAKAKEMLALLAKIKREERERLFPN